MNITDEQLKLINQKAKEELKAEDLYVFKAKVIGDNLIEERQMKIGKTALEKFVENAKDGVPLMLNHSWASFKDKPFPFGRSYDAELKKGDNEDNAVYVDFYVAKDIELGGENTTDIIKGIQTGTLSDMSVGFRAKEAVRKNMDKDDEYYEITDAELFEVSLVFAPAYKGASVQKFDDIGENTFFLSDNGEFLGGSGGEILDKLAKKNIAKDDELKVADEVKPEVEDEKLDEEVEEVEANEEVEETEVEEPTNETTEEENEAKETKAEDTKDDIVDIDKGGHYYSIDGEKYTASELKMIFLDGKKHREEAIEFTVTEAIKANPDVDAENLKLGFEILSVEQILARGNAYKEVANLSIPVGRKTDSDKEAVIKNKDNSRFKL